MVLSAALLPSRAWADGSKSPKSVPNKVMSVPPSRASLLTESSVLLQVRLVSTSRLAHTDTRRPSLTSVGPSKEKDSFLVPILNCERLTRMLCAFAASPSDSVGRKHVTELAEDHTLAWHDECEIDTRGERSTMPMLYPARLSGVPPRIGPLSRPSATVGRPSKVRKAVVSTSGTRVRSPLKSRSTARRSWCSHAGAQHTTRSKPAAILGPRMPGGRLLSDELACTQPGSSPTHVPPAASENWHV